MANDAPDLSGLLSGLLKNPAALSALSGLLGARDGRASAEPPAPPTPEGEVEEAKEASVLPLPSPTPTGRQGERAQLLMALRPYLSAPRKRALEGVEKMLEILEIFHH